MLQAPGQWCLSTCFGCSSFTITNASLALGCVHFKGQPWLHLCSFTSLWLHLTFAHVCQWDVVEHFLAEGQVMFAILLPVRPHDFNWSHSLVGHAIGWNIQGTAPQSIVSYTLLFTNTINNGWCNMMQLSQNRFTFMSFQSCMYFSWENKCFLPSGKKRQNFHQSIFFGVT